MRDKQRGRRTAALTTVEESSSGPERGGRGVWDLENPFPGTRTFHVIASGGRTLVYATVAVDVADEHYVDQLQQLLDDHDPEKLARTAPARPALHLV